VTLRLLPDAEALLSAHLRADTDVQALVGQRVYTMLPSAKEWPLVRLQRVGGPSDGTPTGYALLRDQALLQVECYGGPKAVAWQVANTVRASIAQTIAGPHTGGWCERATLGNTRYLPDESFDPARPRVLFDVTLFLRPAGDYPTP